MASTAQPFSSEPANPSPPSVYSRGGDTAPAAVAPAAGRSFGAVIFDLDGVITDTAAVHFTAWKRLFDEFLWGRARACGGPFREFSHTSDYLRHVDGRPRYQGVASFLESRGVELPYGAPTDPADVETICGLGNRKNELFNALIATEGVRLYRSSLDLIHALRDAGVRIGLATSSRNAALILRLTGTEALFDTIVDGLVSARQGLRGKPHPDSFVTACASLGTTPARAIVVEDAVAGVQAGATGGFALVVGVARAQNAAALRENGADLVVTDLAELTIDDLDRKVRLKAPGC